MNKIKNYGKNKCKITSCAFLFLNFTVYTVKQATKKIFEKSFKKSLTNKNFDV